MQDHRNIRGFYAVLDRGDAALTSALIAGGAAVLQLRMKAAGTRELVAAARAVRAATAAAGVLLVVNDRVDVALAVDADGVHLGQDDLSLADARRVAGGRLLIGISTHDLAQVDAAVAGGADYLGFGPVFSTTTKADAEAARGLDALAAAVARAGAVPVVAIGGITPERAEAVRSAGAAAACAIAAVNGAPDVAAAAAGIARWWRA